MHPDQWNPEEGTAVLDGVVLNNELCVPKRSIESPVRIFVDNNTLIGEYNHEDVSDRIEYDLADVNQEEKHHLVAMWNKDDGLSFHLDGEEVA